MIRPVRILQLEEVEPRVLSMARAIAFEAGVSSNLSGAVHCEAYPSHSTSQFRADVLLTDCVSDVKHANQLSLVLTSRDLYVPSLSYVFGIAMRNLNACIVSCFRLGGNTEVFGARLAKEIIHEVGHLNGLRHCQDSSCVMSFSNTVAAVDRKKPKFCLRCTNEISSFPYDRDAGNVLVVQNASGFSNQLAQRGAYSSRPSPASTPPRVSD